ncbi:HprK-related kinase B [Pseudooceanicola aestuarii]|uniref:HprK-related kinase B n=1 Tax=Pseudooceanicola aestuarii TaxID=2697319 RepID=UPI0013D1F6F4|nr:HprK-related kinase B [Pseudooceanicola aestuarii]
MRVAEILDRLDLAPARQAVPFHLAIGPVGITVLCPGPLRATLTAYFAEAMSDKPGAISVHLLPDQALSPAPRWTDWAREEGKTGRKDAVCDLEDGRLVRKVRSGVTFVQAPGVAVALGPLTDSVSTVINFINTQVLSDRMRAGWQLAHAAAVTHGDQGLAISGLSGGGKSTSALRMMDIAGTRFVSNDRVLLKNGQALGIPKHPRINPGTILGNPRLHDLLTASRRAELAALPPADLWDLEDKHDLMISKTYGPGRVQYAAPLTEFWVLNWSRAAAAPMRLATVTLAERPDLLGAIMKSPGPFHQAPDGRFEPDGTRPDPAPYLAALRGVTLREVAGRVDFDALAARGRALFAGQLADG